MSLWQAQKDLADAISENLMKGREDSESAATEIADAIYDLIDRMIEDRTGAC